jgi:hypothetical protein
VTMTIKSAAKCTLDYQAYFEADFHTCQKSDLSIAHARFLARRRRSRYCSGGAPGNLAACRKSRVMTRTASHNRALSALRHDLRREPRRNGQPACDRADRVLRSVAATLSRQPKGSLLTPRWREMDSNLRSLPQHGWVAPPNVKTSGREIEGRSLETEASLARNRRFPFPSREESANLRSLSS